MWIVGDAASLEGASVSTLRMRFRTMREQGKIPEGTATDCFLVVDEATLRQHNVASRIFYRPKSPDFWATTTFVWACDPDHDNSAPVTAEGDLYGFVGQISIPLPKGLAGCTTASLRKARTGTRYKATKSGPPELTVNTLNALFAVSTCRTPALIVFSHSRAQRSLTLLCNSSSFQGPLAPYPFYNSLATQDRLGRHKEIPET